MFNELYNDIPLTDEIKVSAEQIEAEKAAVFSRIQTEGNTMENAPESISDYTIGNEPQAVYPGKTPLLRIILPLAAAAAVIAAIPFIINHFGKNSLMTVPADSSSDAVSESVPYSSDAPTGSEPIANGIPSLAEISRMTSEEANALLIGERIADIREVWEREKETDTEADIWNSEGEGYSDWNYNNINISIDLISAYGEPNVVKEVRISVKPVYPVFSEENGIEYMIFDEKEYEKQYYMLTDSHRFLLDYADRYAIVYGYTGEDETLVIPETLGGAPVLGIDSGWSLSDGFWMHSHESSYHGETIVTAKHTLSDKVQHIVVPKTVKYIGESAFGAGFAEEGEFGYTPLAHNLVTENEYVILGDGVLYSAMNARGDITSLPAEVKTVCTNAFSHGKMRSIVVPDSMTSIDLSGCQDLESVTLSADCEISASAFRGALGTFLDCPNIREVIVPENSTGYTVIDGAVFSKDGKELVMLPPKRGGSAYTVPEGTETLGIAAFRYCKDITIELPYSLQTFDVAGWGKNYPSPFIGTENITIKYNGKTYHIEGEEKTKEPEHASLYSADLETLTELHEDIVNSIAAIYTNSEMTRLTLADKWEFADIRDCPNLESVTLGQNTRYLSDRVFYGTPNLREIIVPEDHGYFESEDGVIFSKVLNNRSLIKYPPKLGGSEYVVPEGTTSIAEGAFYLCENLTVYLPDSLKRLPVEGIRKSFLAASICPLYDGNEMLPAFCGAKNITIIYKGKTYYIEDADRDVETLQELYGDITGNSPQD